jgi:D-alanine-D-alanine ligase
MDQKISVGLFYNDIPGPLSPVDSTVQAQPLNFKPVYDLEPTDTAEEIGEIEEALRKEGFEVFSHNLLNRLDDLINLLKRRKPDVVFNLVESFYDSPLKEMMVTGVYEMLGIPYTGSPPLTLGICQRKGLSKQILLANGISTPRFKLMAGKKISNRQGLHYPLIVKPAREDGSIGVENESVVYNLRELKRRCEYILGEFRQPAIVEEFIDGRELNVSVLGSEEPVVLPISEIDFSTMPESFENIVTYQAKWEPRHETYHRTIPICPARLPRRVERRVREIALKAFQIMGCRDYARIDIRLDRKNNPFVLEVNPNPHLSEGMGLMRSAEASGLPFSQTLRKIVEFALRRPKILSPPIFHVVGVESVEGKEE